MNGIVVKDGMDELAGRNHGLDYIKEVDERLMAVALHITTDHDAIEDAEGGRAMPLVVVDPSWPSASAGHHFRESDVQCTCPRAHSDPAH